MKYQYLEKSDIPRLLPQRPARSNKATFGRVLAVCGSRGMSGAAYLCAKAAYRTGCGLVEILTTADNRVILQTLLPEAIVTCYDEQQIFFNTQSASDNIQSHLDSSQTNLAASTFVDAAPRPFSDKQTAVITTAISRADVIAVGCGLGQSRIAEELLLLVLSHAKDDQPLVIDADALNILSKRPELWSSLRSPAVITPHPSEMSRLTSLGVGEILADTVGTATVIAEKLGVVCLLKDHESVVTDGKKIYLNKSGNSGMATGGSGDVLCGIIASLLAQSRRASEAQTPAADITCGSPVTPTALQMPLSFLDAAALGAFIHGLAGDAAAEELGEYSVMASDIIEHLPGILRESHGITIK